MSEWSRYKWPKCEHPRCSGAPDHAGPKKAEYVRQEETGDFYEPQKVTVYCREHAEILAFLEWMDSLLFDCFYGVLWGGKAALAPSSWAPRPNLPPPPSVRVFDYMDGLYVPRKEGDL